MSVKLTEGVCLLRDIPPVRTAAISQATVRERVFQELEYPPYSSNMASSNYYYFLNLKKYFR